VSAQGKREEPKRLIVSHKKSTGTPEQVTARNNPSHESGVSLPGLPPAAPYAGPPKSRQSSGTFHIRTNINNADLQSLNVDDVDIKAHLLS
jgi:hypothetical protein